jgi:quercetin dioxygenase-like cupin family protein
MGIMRSAAFSLGFVLLGGVAAFGQDSAIEPDRDGFIALQPESIEPEAGDGITRVWITGGADEPGIYVVRNTFPPGVTSKPHFHSQDRYVTVIKGTWWIALGDDAEVYDPEKMVPMREGSFVKHPAGAVHYDGAKDEAVVVQIIGMGPVTTTQLSPEPVP